MKNHITSALTLFLLISTPVLADDIVCPSGFDKVEINAALTFGTNIGCPFLTNNRTLVKKLFPNSQYPGAPFCLSGIIKEGSTMTINGSQKSITGFTDSAQRIFAEAIPFTPPELLPLFLDGENFMSGAGSTVLNLSWEEGSQSAKIVFDERLTVDKINSMDYEEFSLVAVFGKWRNANGRLSGQGIIGEGPVPGSIYAETFSVTGGFCAK